MDSPATPRNVSSEGSAHWRRNLWVCTAGSFTTIVAMTLLLPFLPIYVEELGVHDRAAIVQWSGVAYGATFLTAGLFAPVWGRLADLYGRKLMLIRASLGMAIAMSLIGMAQNVWQLVGLRLLAGLLGGYSSGSNILVATQTPQTRTGWALGVLASGVMAGTLIGPLIGGALPPLIGVRATFLAAGAVIFATFVATATLIREDRRPPRAKGAASQGGWAAIPDKRHVFAMLIIGTLLMVAMMSVEPIITIYVATLVPDPARVTLAAGVVMAAAALGSIVSAARLGRFADRVGHWRVIVGSMLTAAVLLVPQAFVAAEWQLVGLRFLMGLALGGLMPCVISVIRHSVPAGHAGGILGYATAAQYAGQVAGPLIGGFVGGHFGMRAVFLGTSVLMAAGAAYAWTMRPRVINR